jgi:hypothetical protein
MPKYEGPMHFMATAVFGAAFNGDFYAEDGVFGLQYKSKQYTEKID